MNALLDLAARCEQATGKEDPAWFDDLARAIHKVDPRSSVNGSCQDYGRSLDAAMTLLPKTAVNIDIFSYSRGWACRFMDTAQLMGARAAKEQIVRMKKIAGYGRVLRGEPRAILEKAIAEHYLEFMCLGATTPALALCAAALRARAA